MSKQTVGSDSFTRDCVHAETGKQKATRLGYWPFLVGIVIIMAVVAACVTPRRSMDRSTPVLHYAQPIASENSTEYPREHSSITQESLQETLPQDPALRQLPRPVVKDMVLSILMAFDKEVRVQVQSVAGLKPGSYRFSQEAGRIRQNGRLLPAGPQQWGSQKSLWSVDQRPLRGTLQVVPISTAQQQRVAVVLQLPIESYIAAVVSKEVEPDWPVAALAAQAIAARSYAVASWQWQGDKAWCLQAEAAADMAFAGEVGTMHRHLRQAMSQTRGQVLWWNDQAVLAFFHASSGGRSELPHAVWPQRQPDLRPLAAIMPARLDPWAQAGIAVAPKRLGPWRKRLHLDDITRRLRHAGWRIPPIHEVRIVERSGHSGRVLRVAVHWPEGKREMDANQFRHLG